MIAGIDEVGRGCLFGPVITCAVILPDDVKLHQKLTDSKKLTPKWRQELSKWVIDNCIEYYIGMSTVEEIDDHNILQATMIAMHRSINGLTNIPSMLLIDGNYFVNKTSIPHQTVIKGDLTVPQISAASIVAKVYRDSLMIELSKTYDKWDIHNNMGYGTKKHIEGIRQYGYSDMHRKTFEVKL
jgi:ribonuclease HII